ncbi:MAG TPA: DEAD/DEAH box helicase [Kineosporiaceae bacterium]
MGGRGGAVGRRPSDGGGRPPDPVLVIHGLWSTGGLLAWAEDAQAASWAAPRPGRRPAVAPHPYAADAGALRRGLDPLAAGEPVATEAVLTLPTQGGLPCASPEVPAVVDADERVRKQAALVAGRWRVPAVCFATGGAALAALLAEPSADTVTGAGWRHLRELALFADDLAGRGRVLPVVLAGTDRPEARWRPLMTRDDAAWARALATSAPPSIAAAWSQPARSPVARGAVPAGSAPAGTVAAALDALVDAAARRRLTEAEPRVGSGLATPFGGAASRDTASKGTAAAAAAWLRALVGGDGTFDARPDEVLRLAADLAEWQRDALDRPARARFRLVEPPEIVEPLVVVPAPEPAAVEQEPAAPPGAAARPEGATRWRLEFALQATREPSLVAAADDVWRGGEAVAALARHVDTPRQTLLAELGRAQRLVPAIGTALRDARPSALELDTAGAHAFLTSDAATLSAAGFGVELPGWWGRPARLGVRLNAASPTQPGIVAGTAALGQAALVDYRWEVALGDQRLTLDELTALARVQQPLVRVRGQWVEVDPRGLQRALAILRRGGGRPGSELAGQMALSELFAALGAGETGPGGLPVLAVRAEGWLGDLLSGNAERRVEPVPPPAGFTGRLRPYQERGLAWLAFLDRLGLGAVLADDMGLGKTVQLLALIARDVDATAPGEPAAPTLLVCPMSLVGNWQREAGRFTPGLRVHVHHGSDRAKGTAFEAAVAASDLVVTTYAIAARDAAALGAWRWRRVVLDEAQAVKNAATRQAQAVRSLPAAHRVAVTGTPVENRLADLWSIMEFANPGLLGGAAAFRERYAVPIERHGDDAAAARLRGVTQPFVLRRLKTDRSIISDLPDKLEMEVFCSLTAEQAALYRAVVDDMLDRIAASEGMERRGLVLATMTKLKQVCNHPAQLLRDGSRLAGRSGKLARVEEIVEEVLAAGEKALIFTQFAQFGGMLRAHLSARFGREVLSLHGGVGKRDRDAMVARFTEGGPGSPALFVLSLKAGGTGLNLTAANHVLHVDRWWNPAVEDQATDRAFRIGQTRAVQVRKLVCAGTLEERISAMIADKRGLAARIVGTGEGWLTELSTDQLRDLLRLDASAVAE